LQIGEDEVRTLVLEAFERTRDGGHGGRSVASPLEEQRGEDAAGEIVFDDEDSRSVVGFASDLPMEAVAAKTRMNAA
jgi:hypothetical protein